MQSWLVGGASDCDIVVDRPVVSARHCRLLREDDGRWFVDDLNSANGTFVNGQLVTTRAAVTSTDRVTLGRETALPWPSTTPAQTTSLVIVGRDLTTDVVLEFPMVSLRHAFVRVMKTGTVIEDLKSTNGTFIGTRTNRITASPLQPTDTLFFGSLKVSAKRLLLSAAERARQKEIYLDLSRKSQIVLGRDPNCDHALDFPMISWHHARISRGDAGLLVEDLGSSNGTFVNGQRVLHPIVLKAGDVVGLGSFTFTVTSSGELQKRSYQGNISLHVDRVCVAVPGKQLLHEISFTILPSEFVGLMGLSGAGKSTLMNALNGYCLPTRGGVLFNADDLYEHYDQFRGHIGYVPQDDIIHPDLTVGESLYFSARLRLPSDFTDEAIRRRITNVLAQLGLVGTEEVLIGSPEKKGISGGQRKRVNLGMELLTDPSVLFLDEPTSGLSSEDALIVMKLLRELADGGKTILLTIHQPSLEVFRLLDNLVVLTKDPSIDNAGRLAYYGPAFPDAIQFFNTPAGPDESLAMSRNPDDILRGLTARSTAEWLKRYEQSKYQREFDAQRTIPTESSNRHAIEPKVKRANGFLPWWTLVRRGFTIKLRDRSNSVILLLQAPIIGLLIALVFGNQSRQSVTSANWTSVASATATTVFLLVLAAIWFGCSSAAREIVGEWAIFRRERMVNLGIAAYLGSKLAVLYTVCLGQCAVLLGIVHWSNGLQGSWTALYLTMVLGAMVGVGIGLSISAAARSSEVAIACLPLVILPMVILGGVLQPLGDMNGAAKRVAQFMPSRWAFEAAILVESEVRPKWSPPNLSTASDASSSPRAQDEMVDKPRDMAEAFFPVETDRMGIPAGVVALLGMVAVLTIAAASILLSRDTH